MEKKRRKSSFQTQDPCFGNSVEKNKHSTAQIMTMPVMYERRSVQTRPRPQ